MPMIIKIRKHTFLEKIPIKSAIDAFKNNEQSYQMITKRHFLKTMDDLITTWNMFIKDEEKETCKIHLT